MKLSEAIRLGAMSTERGKRMLRSETGATCAIGAALSAIGRLDEFARARCNDELWPTPEIVVLFPLLGATLPYSAGVRTVYEIVADLNDSAGWTREQIADWVESLERLQEASCVSIGEAEPETLAPSVARVRS